MRIRLRGTRKSGGELCKIDRFDFEQSDDQARKTFDPSEIPAKMKFEDIGEHGSMIHGVIPWNASRYGQYCGHILGCLLINDAVIAKGFVLWTGFVQTLPIG